MQLEFMIVRVKKFTSIARIKFFHRVLLKVLIIELYRRIFYDCWNVQKMYIFCLINVKPIC